MNFEIEIPDEKLNNVSPNGDVELKSLTKNFVEDVLDEASRIEAANNTANANPEITASIVRDAHDYVRKFNIKPKKENWVIWTQIVAFITTLLTGGMFSVADFSQTQDLILFLIVFFVAGSSTVVLTFKEIRK